MHLRIADSALQDLKAIQRYYRDQDAASVGQQFVTDIVHKLERLKTHPQSGRVLPEFEAQHIRELIHPPFRVVYLLDNDDIVLIRVWRSERRLQLPE